MRYAALGLLLAIPLLAGCGQTTGKVSGQVTYRGKAVPGGLVTFRPVDGRQNSVTAELDTEGRYSVVLPGGDMLVSVDNRELQPRPVISGGIPPGLPISPEARAKLGRKQPAAPAEGEPKTGEDVRRPSGRYLPIPEKYYDAETSNLKFTVQGGDQMENLELTD